MGRRTEALEFTCMLAWLENGCLSKRGACAIKVQQVHLALRVPCNTGVTLPDHGLLLYQYRRGMLSIMYHRVSQCHQHQGYLHLP